jgi:hypothetical protein
MQPSMRLYAYDPPADALYRSVFGAREDSETWFKEVHA